MSSYYNNDVMYLDTNISIIILLTHVNDKKNYISKNVAKKYIHQTVQCL